MKTYILFIFGMFDDHEDIEFFCSHVITESKTIESIRFIIENSENIIVIFDSSEEPNKISEDLFPLLKFGHYFCPFFNSPKKSLKKKRYKTINRERGLKNRVKKETFWFPFKPFWFPFKPFWFPFKPFLFPFKSF